MRKGQKTRARMVAVTAELLQRQGLHATGLNAVVRRSQSPKGSLYFHFPGGKEELACEALLVAGADWKARLSALIDAIPDPGDAMLAAIRFLADELESSGFHNGCPLATVALEASGRSDAMRHVCAEVYDGWQQLFERKLTEAGQSPEDAAKVATFALCALEGGLLLSRVHRDTTILESVGEQVKQLYEQLIN